ncbi:hypothetical protein [Phocaeicola plebeius]|jgi:hypothetical protein|uniref:hypothetical protein n=1 Tax=Phocaeicola plebeius TaxID=310297 RepID=UPI0018978541|nr:hypothetical protein [Phocaeicola plebeius]
MSANKIKILSISEKSFFLEKELLPNTLEDCEKELHPGIGFKIMIDKENSKLTFDTTIFYANNTRIVSSIEYLYTLLIEDIDKIVISSKDDKLLIQDSFFDVIIPEIYITGRALFNKNLINTPIENLYLPFNGYADLLKQIKEDNNKENR